MLNDILIKHENKEKLSMQFEQQKQAETNDYNISNMSYSVNDYTAAFFKSSIEDQRKNKVAEFKSRLDEFRKVSTLQEAKELLNKIMPVEYERNVFNVGNAQCIIINRENLLRITLDSESEFISFNFQ